MTTIGEDRSAAAQPRVTSASAPRSVAVDEPTTERPIISAVIYLLGAIALLGLAGVIGLVAAGADTSSLAALTALVGPAIGGLASILATTRTHPSASHRKDVEHLPSS
jgi:hypothetical protein